MKVDKKIYLLVILSKFHRLIQSLNRCLSTARFFSDLCYNRENKELKMLNKYKFSKYAHKYNTCDMRTLCILYDFL